MSYRRTVFTVSLATLLTLSSCGCSRSDGSLGNDAASTASPAAGSPSPAEPSNTVATPSATDVGQLIYPEPWEFQDGSSPGAFGITPYRVLTSAGVLQLGLIREVSPKHVKALQDLFGSAGYTGVELRPALEGAAIRFQTKELRPKLASESRKARGTLGSLYSDGEGGLLFLARPADVPEGWNFVGQVIVEQKIVSEVFSKDAKRTPVVIKAIEGLAM